MRSSPTTSRSFGTVNLALMAAWCGSLALTAAAADKDGFKIKPKGYVQFDARSYTNWDVAAPELRNEASELRRLRFGFDATWKSLAVDFSFDPQDEGARLKDAALEWRLADAFQLRAGHFKVPVSPEWLTSASRIDFLERSLLVSNMGPGRDYGVQASGEVFSKRLAYQAGVFDGDGQASFERAGTTVAARVVVSPARWLDFGASASHGAVAAEPESSAANVELQPKGAAGEGPSGFRYFNRPFVDGDRRRYDFELALRDGPWQLRGEVLILREQRLGQGSVFNDLPDVEGRGWLVAGTWLVTGETKRGSVKPKRPLPRGPGAIELAVRYEDLRFDDVGPDTGFAGAGNRARNIRPAADRVFTGGLSWWPTAWIRLIGNVAVERYLDELLAPERGRHDNYVTLLGRIQLQVP